MERISHISTGVSLHWTLHYLELSNHVARMCHKTVGSVMDVIVLFSSYYRSVLLTFYKQSAFIVGFILTLMKDSSKFGNMV